MSTQLAPGVFVSDLSTDEWEPDTEPPGEVPFLCSDVEVNAGLWRSVLGGLIDEYRWAAA